MLLCVLSVLKTCVERIDPKFRRVVTSGEGGKKENETQEEPTGSIIVSIMFCFF